MYSTISNIRESLKLAWDNKILWILAMLIGGGMALSPSLDFMKQLPKSSTSEPKYEKFQFEGSTTDTDAPKPLYKIHVGSGESTAPVTPTDSSFGDMVLGTTTSLSKESVSEPNYLLSQLNLILKFIKNISWILPVLILAMIFSIIIRLCVTGWSNGGFMAGQLKAVNSTLYGFKELGSEGKRLWARFIKLEIFYGLIKLAVMIPSLLLVGLWLAFRSLGVIPVLLSVILFFVGIIYMIIFTFAGEFSRRIIVEQDINTIEAFKMGFKYYKTRPGKSIKLAILIPLFLTLAVMCLSLIAGIYGTVVSALVNQGGFLIVPGYLLTFIGLLFVLLLFTVGGPYLVTFNAFCWTNLYMFTKNSFELPEVEEMPLGLYPGQSNTPVAGQDLNVNPLGIYPGQANPQVGNQEVQNG